MKTLARNKPPAFERALGGGARIATIGIALVCAGSLGAQEKWVPDVGMTKEKLEPGPGEITVDKAVDACRAFFIKLGPAVPEETPRGRRISSNGSPGGTVGVTYLKEMRFFLVNERCGEVSYYANGEPDDDHRSRRLAPGPLRLPNALSAQNYAWSVMEGLGLGKDCKLVELQCLHFPGGSDSDSGYPQVSAVFQPVPLGYRIESKFGKCQLVLDALDGCVVAYRRQDFPENAFTIEAHAATVKQSEALARATPVLEKWGVGPKPESVGTDGPFWTKPSQLMFVWPNGLYGGVQYDHAEKPARLRLAWVFFYHAVEEIWIDAADGKVLGGRSRAPSKLRAPPHKH